MPEPLQTKILCFQCFATRWAGVAIGLALLVAGVGCHAGLEPPSEPGFGRISVQISYTGAWPNPSELQDLRFVALRFIPRDTTDLLQLNRMVISRGLQRNVTEESVLLDLVPEGEYVYAGVAQQFSTDIFDWRPVGLVDGAFRVEPDLVTHVSAVVDFGNLPPFPPTP